MDATLMLVILGLLGLWALHLMWRPWKDCPACDGSPKRRGKIATRTFYLCKHCGGSGRVRRFGAGDG